MKQNFYFFHKKTHQSGFTFIELIIVFTVMTMLSVIGIVAFVNYTNSQQLINAQSDVLTMLNSARSQAFSQVKPSQCTSSDQSLKAYKVLICCSGVGCPSCLSSDSLEIDAVCGNNNTYLISSKDFPSGVSVVSNGTTSHSFSFTPLSGAVNGSGNVKLQGYYNKTITITVSSSGVIQ